MNRTISAGIGTPVRIVAVIFCMGAVQLFPAPPVGAEETAAERQDEREQIRSAREDWRDTLRYGIDSEVLDLLKTLKEQKEESVNGEIDTLLRSSLNPQVRRAALSHLQDCSDDRAEDEALRIVQEHEDKDSALVETSIRYLSAVESRKSATALVPMLDAGKEELVAAAIKALGRLGNDREHAGRLGSLYEDEETPTATRGEIILALGEMKAHSALEKLIGILEDSEEEPVLRRYACHSLGKIGDEAAIAPLRRAYGENDTQLRAYAVAALASFSGREVRDVLTSALRDSFWRVRVSAIQALADMKDRGSVDILLYKARKDPEPNVRDEAIKALGAIGSRDAVEYLRDLYKDEVTNPRYREAALRALIENDLSGSLSVFREVIEENWEKKDSFIVERTCRLLSEQESSTPGPLYERMLDHANFVIRIYGIRGISRNDLSRYRSRVEKLAEEGNPQPVRKAALSALESL